MDRQRFRNKGGSRNSRWQRLNRSYMDRQRFLKQNKISSNKDAPSSFEEIEGTEYKKEWIVAVSCAQFESYCLMLDRKGQVWLLGEATMDKGRITWNIYVDEEPQKIPYFVTNKLFITMICSGNAHSLALDKNGMMYAWGNNNVGQCGITQKKKKGSGYLKEPMLIEKLKKYKIIDIKANGDCSYAKSDENSHWVWGENKYGQLTLKRMNEQDDTKFVKEPYLISTTFHKMTGKTAVIKDVYFGHDILYIIGSKVSK